MQIREIHAGVGGVHFPIGCSANDRCRETSFVAIQLAYRVCARFAHGRVMHTPPTSTTYTNHVITPLLCIRFKK
jgi:hypothetical protein